MSVYYFNKSNKKTETPAERRKRENQAHIELVLKKRIDKARRDNPQFWEMVDSDEFRDWWENEALRDYSIFHTHPEPDVLPLIVESIKCEIKRAELHKLSAMAILMDGEVEPGRIRRIKQAMATPQWADKDKIKEIYSECRKLNKEYGFIAFHVDHVIPIQGQYVSGLHVENNLEIIKAIDNVRKSNKYEIIDN